MSKYIYWSENEESIANFRQCMVNIGRADSLVTINKAILALVHIVENNDDVIFLPVDECGVETSKMVDILLRINETQKIVLVSNNLNDAFDVLGLELTAFLPKPVQEEQLLKLLNKIEQSGNDIFLSGSKKSKEIRIVIGPNFRMFIDGVPVFFQRKKVKELLEVLVKADGNVVSIQMMAKELWPENAAVKNRTNSIRVLMYGLKKYLKELGIGRILCGNNGLYYLDKRYYKVEA